MDVSRLWTPVTRWAEFRRRQLAALEESNRIAAQSLEGSRRDRRRGRPRADAPPCPRPWRTPGPRDRGARPWTARRALPAAPPTASSGGRSTGTRRSTSASSAPSGRCSRSACGSLVGRLTTTLTLLIVSIFLAPRAQPDRRRASSRAACAAPAPSAVVFAGLLVAFGLIGALVIPPVVVEGAELAQQAPSYVEDVLDSPLGARARQELRRHRQGAGGARGADDRPAVPRGRARRHPRRRPRGAQRRLPGLHRARADPVLPLLAPPRQARRLRPGARLPSHPGRVAVRGDHAADGVVRDRPGRHRHAQRGAVLRHDDASSASRMPRCSP